MRFSPCNVTLGLHVVEVVVGLALMASVLVGSLLSLSPRTSDNCGVPNQDSPPSGRRRTAEPTFRQPRGCSARPAAEASRAAPVGTGKRGSSASPHPRGFHCR